ncbi:hypothetical protein [Leifsonia poae]|uniref:hypothetical protein n=1 Tax=Leifsonia poae TaxID=110933 RepID=UPI001CBB1AA7|nr:hypothetical protein [Leifsonia poae]
MSESILSALIGGGVTLAVGFLAAFVAIWVYRAGDRARREEAATEQRRLTVIRMLDTIDRAIRWRSAPSVVRFWRNPVVDLTLALPRLLLELPGKDLPVAQWAAGQVQRAALAISLKAFVNRMMTIEGKLISWHRGDVPTSWFVEQLDAEPYSPRFRVPMGIRIAIYGRDLVQNFGLGIALGVGILGIQRRGKP